MLIFDVETGPLPLEELNNFLPEGGFVANKTLKDPEKIRVDLQNKLDDFYSKAALSAVTGRVLAIGIFNPERPEHDTRILGESGDEKALLEVFFATVQAEGPEVIGFNITNFDLPFLIRRAWKLGVSFPNFRSNRYWSSNVLDLMEVWNFYNKNQYESLDTISKHLGIGSKTKGISGGDFAPLWLDPTTRPQVIEYLKNDVQLTYKLYQRLCC